MIDYHIKKIMEAVQSDLPAVLKQTVVECQLREYAVQVLLEMIEKQQEEILKPIKEKK